MYVPAGAYFISLSGRSPGSLSTARIISVAMRNPWTRPELLAAFSLYCRLPFGGLHSRNSEIVRLADAIGRTPSAVAMKLSNIASLDPVITSTGRVGLTSASAADRTMWEEMNSDWDQFVADSQKALESFGFTDPVNDSTSDSVVPEGLDRPIQSTTRVGQGFFRQVVLSAYNGKCCITGLAVPRLLVASHIVPWRHDRTNRVNPRNGLLLSALHDRAFDAGLITINDDMTVRVSPAYADNGFFSTAIYAYDGKPIQRPEKFAPDRDFLAYHRDNIFQS